MRAETHAPQWSYWTVVDFVFRPPPTRELYPRKPDSRYKVGEPLARQRKGEPGGGSSPNVAQILMDQAGGRALPPTRPSSRVRAQTADLPTRAGESHMGCSDFLENLR